jgi:hypothetical protein
LALSFCYFATQSWPKQADHLRWGLSEQQGQQGKTPRASRPGRRHSPFGFDRFVHRLRFGGGMRWIGIQVCRIPIGDTDRLALSFCHFARQSLPNHADRLRRGLRLKGALDGEAAIVPN